MDQSDDRIESSRRALTVIGAPLEDGAGVAGTVMGPAALRTAGLIRTLRDLGNEVDDRGDLRLEERVPEPVLMAGSARNIASVAGWARMLRRETYAAMKNGRVPIVLGGDHSLSIGSVSGVLQYCAEAGRTLFVLWLDAHADFNTPATSPSGNLHGMSAAWLCGEPGLPVSEEPRVTLDPKNLHLFGVRAVDRGERDLLHARGVDIVDMRQLDEFGASVLMRRIIDEARRRNGLIHVSLDVDFLDPQLAPGPEPRCRAAPRSARRIWSWRCCTIAEWSARSTWSSSIRSSTSAAGARCCWSISWRACSAARSSNGRHRPTCLQTLPAHDVRRDRHDRAFRSWISGMYPSFSF